ncbi:CMGC/CDK protein kinase [Sphaeroforma arctica JP610]|uniref:CMGC/CDK protein kinase n=1 Tax=Sphaeroforma arctica JP610 TaxID=667725 RepID=A0A0L0FJL4_9EUKA|nr:CMGC/CDK protein kinase [Sphaeroforma arctica JP610]KNC76955.1 CMGC/CDK protein kinase [Sphaeroforma arctica JP610]|eukprot:XP_014150857.1 CMGC/CDK protein kinase [Sphaeroforma arctica JP610]
MHSDKPAEKEKSTEKEKPVEKGKAYTMFKKKFATLRSHSSRGSASITSFSVTGLNEAPTSRQNSTARTSIDKDIASTHHLTPQAQIKLMNSKSSSNVRPGVSPNRHAQESKLHKSAHLLFVDSNEQPVRRKSMPHVVSTQTNKQLGYGKVESYQKLEKLGEGTYAQVYRGVSTITGEQCALKEINLDAEEGAPCTAIREASLLRELKHVNIVILHDIVHTHTSMTFVFEYLNMDLKDYIDRAAPYVALTNVRLLFYQLLRALECCARKRILHRDIKPQNILLNEIGELKLADFGLARAKGVPIKSFSHEVVTLWYRPLDILLGSVDYNSSLDIWSAGCILAELVTGTPLFPGKDHDSQLTTVFSKLGTPSPDTWPELENLPLYSKIWTMYAPKPFTYLVPRLESEGIRLLSEMVVYEPAKRISAKEAMRHEYFEDLPCEIHALRDDQSVFSVPGVRMFP